MQTSAKALHWGLEMGQGTAAQRPQWHVIMHSLHCNQGSGKKVGPFAWLGWRFLISTSRIQHSSVMFCSDLQWTTMSLWLTPTILGRGLGSFCRFLRLWLRLGLKSLKEKVCRGVSRHGSMASLGDHLTQMLWATQQKKRETTVFVVERTPWFFLKPPFNWIVMQHIFIEQAAGILVHLTCWCWHVYIAKFSYIS